MGLVKALELYEARDQEAHCRELNAVVDRLASLLEGLPPIRVGKSTDEAGRSISRVRVDVLPDCPLTAQQIGDRLKSGNPAVFTRDHFLNVGTIFFDPRPMLPGDAEAIAARMKEILKG